MYNIRNILIVFIIIFVTTKSQDDPMKPVDTVKERIHVQKCRQYQTAVYDYISVSPLIAGGEKQKIRVDKCGHKRVPLIVGGILAQPKEFPHMALIGFDGGNDTIHWACGGTLISDRYVLTAAHCAYSRELGEPQFVRLGDLDISKTTDDAFPKDYSIEKIIPHPDWKISLRYNDIALIKLNETVKLNPYMRPVCLPTEFEDSEEHSIATGWGNTKWSGTPSVHLQKVILEKFSYSECNILYGNQVNILLNNGVKNDTQLCAGSKSDNKDTCQGDSGGPLQVYHHNEYCMYTVIGITSFGIICGSKGVPGIYTRVFPYVDWIENIVWKS